MALRKGSCLNRNHGNPSAPVRFCPICGEVVNQNIPVKNCVKEKHDKSRIQRMIFCVDCGEQLVRGR
jgi:hypothetical protein